MIVNNRIHHIICSFTRRLRRWGFHRIETNEQRSRGLIICSCPRFRRGRPDLCKAMCDDRQHKERTRSINPKAPGNQPGNDIIYNDAAPVSSSVGGGQVIVNGWAQNQCMPVGVAPTPDMMQQNQFMPSQQRYMDPLAMMQPMGHPQMFQQNYWNPYQMQMNQQMMMQNGQMNQYMNYPMNPNEFAFNQQQPVNAPFIHDPSSQFNQPQQPSVEPSIICNQSLHNHETQPNNTANDPFPFDQTDQVDEQPSTCPAADSDANLNSRIRANINRIEAELDMPDDEVLDTSKDVPLPHSIESTNVDEIRENIRYIETELAEISRMRDMKRKSVDRNAKV